MEALFATLKQRKRPEDVAQIALEQLQGKLKPSEEKTLLRAAKGSLKRHVLGYTSMAQQFARPIGAQRQVSKAQELFKAAYLLTLEQCDNPQDVERLAEQLSREIHKAAGRSDFAHDRLNGEARRAAGLELSRRRYNKLWRVLQRMEAKIRKLTRELKKWQFQQIANSGLASALAWEEFCRDEDTACFVAYYAARANLRSEFTVRGQQRAFDEIASMLLDRCRHNADANWYAIAHVFPSEEVLARLDDSQKGELLGRWFGILHEVAALLKETWDRSDIRRETMIVRRGNDSTTWNNTAGAWNKARDAWIGLVYAMGMEGVLDAICPGKTLRLMAADVAAWHRREGSALDPDTLVWNELPLPWEVLNGKAICTREIIADACQKHGVEGVKSGWIAPRPRASVAAFRPTPELVHGVTVGNPFLATLLKQAGFFSGKTIKM